MKKYEVLKEFPSSDGGYVHKEGDIYKPTQSLTRTKNLERLGYIEEAPEQPKTIWDLKEGDNYYYIDWFGNKGGCFHAREEDLKYMKRYREVGNCFLALKDAEKELARRKAKVILERDTKGFKPDWNNPNQQKYRVAYEYADNDDVGLGLFVTSQFVMCPHMELWFATQEDAKASVRLHEKEWKIYLGVEE